MVFNDTDGLYTYTFEAERKVCKNIILKKKDFSIIVNSVFWLYIEKCVPCSTSLNSAIGNIEACMFYTGIQSRF